MVKMTKYYCNCLNICVQCGEDSDHVEEYNLSEEEKQHDFFQLLPLIIVQHCIISEQHTALIQLNVIGSWIVHKCNNCAVYTHAMKSDESTSIMFVNGTLKKLTDEETEREKTSPKYSTIFKILLPDHLHHPMDYDGTSHLPREISNSIIELKELLAEKIEERRELTNKLIEQFTLEQETALKSFIKRANSDFQSIKTAVLSNCASEEKEESVISDFDLLASPAKTEPEDIETKDPLALLEFDTSLDYEGVFLFDENDKNDGIVEDSSEEDPPDTDDSGSRDEGIHIPRVKTVNMARSLPIRVRPNFDPSLRIFDERIDDDDEDDADARKPNDKRNKRNKRRPIDIAASMKALAQSVYSDAIFGDLPPPRIGSRI